MPEPEQVQRIHRAADPSFDLRLRCPGCGHLATFEPTPAPDLLYQPRGQQRNTRAGMRTCPNKDCQALVLFTGGGAPDPVGDSRLATYPSNTFSLDTSNVPTAVAAALNEAITCYETQCYMAAGVMIRKTIEEVCDAHGATGRGAAAKLRSLQSQLVVPDKLFAVMQKLKYLGDDAAHTKLKTFRQLGADEIEARLRDRYEGPRRALRLRRSHAQGRRSAGHRRPGTAGLAVTGERRRSRREGG